VSGCPTHFARAAFSAAELGSGVDGALVQSGRSAGWRTIAVSGADTSTEEVADGETGAATLGPGALVAGATGAVPESTAGEATSDDTTGAVWLLDFFRHPVSIIEAQTRTVRALNRR
jgi:hypothetical protein